MNPAGDIAPGNTAGYGSAYHIEKAGDLLIK